MVKMSLITSLIIASIIYAESIDPTLNLSEWHSCEWEEYSDASEYDLTNEEWLININQSSVYQLSVLPGMEIATASKIVRERERGGYFKSLDDKSNNY